MSVIARIAIIAKIAVIEKQATWFLRSNPAGDNLGGTRMLGGLNAEG